MANSIDNNRNNGSVEAMFRGLCERAATAARASAPQQFVAVQAFRGSQETMLSFQVGDTITAPRNQKHIDWWFGYCKGEIGWFPTHCVQSKKSAPTAASNKNNDNHNATLPSNVEQERRRRLQRLRPENNKLLNRVKQVTREGARTALQQLAMVGTDDAVALELPLNKQPTPHSASTTAENKATSSVVSRPKKTTLQLAMEQENALAPVDTPTTTRANLSPTRQVLLYKVQTPLPASLQQRRENLWMSEQHDQRTVSSSSSSSSFYSSHSQTSSGSGDGAGVEMIQTVAPAKSLTKIVGMEVSY